MYTYLENMKSNLSEDKTEMLKSIYAPTVVGVPLSNARRFVCASKNGELYSYGVIKTDAQVGIKDKMCYLLSKDAGLSWEIFASHGKMTSATYIEKGDVYIAICEVPANDETITIEGLSDGLYVLRSQIGPEDKNPEIIKVSDEIHECSFLPTESAYTNRIWFTAEFNHGDGCSFFYSDDFGKTWSRSVLNTHFEREIFYPNKGMSWHITSGREPVVVELSENKMMMTLRTPLDCFYMSFSYDGGKSWSEPKPSSFYGTNTSSYALRISDGRIINFWNNTVPLSQPNHEKSKLYPGDYILNGMGENAFNNRDAAHVAISEDEGKSWIGYRELFLNPIRNNADLRYIGGAESSPDKSVHQFQAIELPYNKVLVTFGQNVAARKTVIFDVDWLYETSREEDFLKGLSNVSVHTYLKSVPGSHIRSAGNGHCALNRTYSAHLMPDPDKEYSEALYVCKREDDRLINSIGGVAWNFPVSKKGRVSAEIKILEKQARFILTDRWYNVCDSFTGVQSPFTFELDAEDVGKEFVVITINYDTEAEITQVNINDKPFFKVKMTRTCPVGISYLIMQCATDGDSKGFYIRKMKKA